ncbi:hypothetical protein [Dryocola clanedunensis]
MTKQTSGSFPTSKWYYHAGIPFDRETTAMRKTTVVLIVVAIVVWLASQQGWI